MRSFLHYALFPTFQFCHQSVFGIMDRKSDAVSFVDMLWKKYVYDFHFYTN